MTGLNVSLNHRLRLGCLPFGLAHLLHFVLKVERALLVADDDVREFLIAARRGDDLRA
jgi:hypothetical protein